MSSTRYIRDRDLIANTFIEGSFSMLNTTLNKTDGLAILEPDGKLSESDFQVATEIIDPYIRETGKLNGLIIHTRDFPGWDSFSAMIWRLIFKHYLRIKFSKTRYIRINIILNSFSNISSF